MQLFKRSQLDKKDIGFLALRLYIIAQFLVLFGIQFFWLIYKWDVVLLENSFDLLALLAPFLLVYLVGVVSRLEKYRKGLRKLEWLLHLMISMLYLIILLLLQFRDEFNPLVPFSWLYYLWVVIIGLDLSSYIIMTLDVPSLSTYFEDKDKFLLFIIVGVPICLLTFGLIMLSRNPVHFWIYAIIFHAIMIPISRSKNYTDSEAITGGLDQNFNDLVYSSFKSMFSRKVEKAQEPKKEKIISINGRNVRIFFLFLLFFLSWNQWGFCHQALASLEDNYYLIIGMFISPWFFLGVGLAFLNGRFKNFLLGDAIGFSIIGLSAFQLHGLAPIALGYALFTLIFLVSAQNSSSRASGLIAIQLGWIFGLYLFAFNGMLIDTSLALRFILEVQLKITIDESLIDENFINIVFIILLAFFFLIVLMLNFLKKILERRKKVSKVLKKRLQIRERKEDKQEVRRPALIMLIVLIGGLISPFFLLGLTSKGPPITLPEKQKITLSDFCGTALAGYSGTQWEYDNLTSLGVKWLRVHFSWRGIEKTNDDFNFSRWDTYMDNTTSHGIKVIAMLNYVPSWLNLSTKEYVPRNYLNIYLDYVNRTVRRYKDTVAAWEIWNEPNLERFWDGPMADFYYLFNETAKFIKSIDPNIYVVGASSSSASAGFVPGNLEEMFAANIMTNVDAISIHYYNYEPNTIHAALLQHFIVGTKHGFKGDYMITELGNPTGGDYNSVVSLKRQAENVIKSHVIASTYNITTFIWYCTKDSGNSTSDQRNSERFFGLTYKDYAGWKPAAHAYSLFSKLCSNSTYRPDLIQKIGGISASDVMAALYQGTDGTSTLILWYDPTLYENGTIGVHITLPAVQGTTRLFDIYKGTNLTLTNTYITLGNAPVFITFQPTGAENPIMLEVEESAISLLIFLTIFGTLIASIVLAKFRKVYPDVNKIPHFFNTGIKSTNRQEYTGLFH